MQDEAYRALEQWVPPAARPRCRTLGDLLTVVSRDVPEAVCEAVDAALRDARANVPLVDAMELPTLPGSEPCVGGPPAANFKAAPFDNIALWRGDITTLKCDAIVNAANSQMLGCFTLGHKVRWERLFGGSHLLAVHRQHHPRSCRFGCFHTTAPLIGLQGPGCGWRAAR